MIAPTPQTAVTTRQLQAAIAAKKVLEAARRWSDGFPGASAPVAPPRDR